MMIEVPKKSRGDIVHALVKGGLAAIPTLGGAAAELFSFVVMPSLEKRQVEWMESVAENLERLEERIEDFEIKSLQGDEQFVTAITHATRSAVRNHRQEKLDALKNAVLNIALKRERDEDLQMMFFNYIDDLTPWHIRILHF